MSYAAPLAYAAKSLPYDPYAPAVASHHPRPAKRRRRRIRLTLLPVLRPRRRQTTVSAPIPAGHSR